jgi:glycosyltransferase involved in cell wall biosynthesis
LLKDLKILHVCNTRKGGAGRAAWMLHDSMSKQGFNSVFFSTDNLEFENSKDENCRILRSPLPESILDRLMRKLKILLLYRKNDRKLRQLEKEYNLIKECIDCEYAGLPRGFVNLHLIPEFKEANVIILHWINECINLNHFFIDFKDTPIVWILHDMNPFQGLYHYKNDEIKNFSVSSEIDRKVFELKKNIINKKKRKFAIVTPSSWLAIEAKLSGFYRNTPISVIANCVDTNVFTIKNKELIRNRFGLSNEDNIILFISESLNNPRKGFELILDSLKYINKNIKIISIGTQNVKLNNTENINFIGKIDNNDLLCDYFNASDVFILPSREDNLPNVMLESLASGCPVIGFSVGGIKDHIKHGSTGLVVDKIDAERLAKAISYFFKTKDEYNAYNIRNYALEHFNSIKQVNSYISLIEQIL